MARQVKWLLLIAAVCAVIALVVVPHDPEGTPLFAVLLAIQVVAMVAGLVALGLAGWQAFGNRKAAR